MGTKLSILEKKVSTEPLSAQAPASPEAQERSAIGPDSSTSPAHVRVLIVDRSESQRRRIRGMFAGEREFRVVGEIGQPNNLAVTCGDLSPDVAILGLGTYVDEPYGWSVLAGLRWIAKPTTRVGAIVLVSNDTPEAFLQPLRAGAKGVLLNDLSKQTLLNAVAEVAAGGAAFDRRLTSMMFDYLADADGPGAPGKQRPMDSTVLRPLSPREQEVLHSLAQGHRNEEIATQLGVSVGTVKTHLRHIYRKLEVGDRVSAVLKGFQLRLPDAA